jgi:hypothetical protein
MGLEAAKASGAEVVAKMKELPTDEDAFGPGLDPARRGAP